MVKIRYCEKATKYEKKYPICLIRRFFSNFLAFSENLNFNWANLWPHPRPLQEYLLQMNSSPSQYSKLLQFWQQCFCWGLDLYERNTHSLGFRVDYWFRRIKTSHVFSIRKLLVLCLSFNYILLIFFLFFSSFLVLCMFFIKNQIVSKANYLVLKSSKKRTKYFQNFAPATRAEVFRSFFWKN